MSINYGPISITNGLISNVILRNSTRHWKATNMIYDLGIWESPSLPGNPFSKAGAKTQTIIDAVGPNGTTLPIWKTTGLTSSYGGIYCTTASIDSDKAYRISYWEKRVTNSTGTYGNHYFGLNGYGSPSGVQYLAGSTPITNPYFWYRGYNQLPSGWFLTVAIVQPYTYSGGNHDDSAVWYPDGTKYQNNSYHFKWLPGTTTARPRTLTIYNGNNAAMEHYSCCTKMELIDGTEPPIDDLIHGRTVRIRDAVTQSYVFLFETTQQDNAKERPADTTSLIMDFDIPDITFTSNDTFSISMWVYADSGANPLIQRDGDTSNNLQIELDASNQVIVKQKNGTTFTRGTLTSSTWKHLTVAVNNKVGKLYIDGIQQSSSFTFTNSFNGSGLIRVGRSRYNWTTNIPGHLYNDIKIFDRELPSEEILSIYNATKDLY